MATTAMPSATSKRPYAALIYSALLLSVAYSLLGLTALRPTAIFVLHQHCVLMNPKMSRIWSVANVEIGLAYFGVFAAMAYYVFTTKEARESHVRDLLLACGYLLGSFTLDYECVQHLQPFPALLVGDAIVMTFTVFVSRQLWFQRLLGVFVPLIFLTCGLGHLLEGLSYWELTYPLNVPWAMVTADIGFAVLVNSARYPAFIRGSDLADEYETAKLQARRQADFFHNVLYSVTDGRFHYHIDSAGLPAKLTRESRSLRLSRESLPDARVQISTVAAAVGFPPDRTDVLLTASGEAMMNAVVHAGAGEVTVCADESAVQVWTHDFGEGIPIEDLPRATLQAGWSSRGTLGMGFSMILTLADRVDLVTGSGGITIVVTVRKVPSDTSPRVARGAPQSSKPATA